MTKYNRDELLQDLAISADGYSFAHGLGALATTTERGTAQDRIIASVAEKHWQKISEQLEGRALTQKEQEVEGRAKSIYQVLQRYPNSKQKLEEASNGNSDLIQACCHKVAEAVVEMGVKYERFTDLLNTVVKLAENTIRQRREDDLDKKLGIGFN